MIFKKTTLISVKFTIKNKQNRQPKILYLYLLMNLICTISNYTFLSVVRDKIKQLQQTLRVYERAECLKV